MTDPGAVVEAAASGDPLSRVFVVHATADDAWVRGYLLPALQEAGIEYSTEDAFEAGTPWSAQVVAAVDAADRVVLVLSQAFVSDHKLRWVELIAEHRGLKEAAYLLLPIRLEQVDLGPALEALVLLDATDPAKRADVVNRVCQDLGRSPAGPAVRPECPYPGLAAFAADDRNRFFGREGEIRSALDRLERQGLIAVVGPSGTGKSSLLLAGVLPRLRDLGWRVAVLRPGNAPLAALESATAGLADAEGLRCLIVVDQLEEVFTAEPAVRERFSTTLVDIRRYGASALAVTMRADFYAQLMESGQLWDLLADHRVEILPLDGEALAEAITGPAATVGVHLEPVLVERLLTDARGEPGRLPLLQETMRLLWRDLERRFLPLRAYTALLGAQGDGVAGDGVGSARTRPGLHVALARHAEAAWAALDPGDRDVAGRVLVRLVQFGVGRPDVRRQATMADLYEGDDPPPAVDRVLGVLIKRRLLVPGFAYGERGEPVIDLAHEALITGWPTFARWLRAHRVAEGTRRALDQQAAQWVARGRGSSGLLDDVELAEAQRWLEGPDPAQVGAGPDIRDLVAGSQAAAGQRRAEEARRRDEQLELQRKLAVESARSARRFRRLTGVLAVLLVVALGAGVIAIVLQARAVEDRRVARATELAQAAAVQPPELVDRALVLAVAGDLLDASSRTRAGLLAALEANPRVVREMHLGSVVSAFAVSPDRRVVVAGTDDGRVTVVDPTNGVVLSRFELPSGEPRSVAVSPDGTAVAVGTSEGDLGLWDTASGGQRGPLLRGHTQSVRAVAFSPNGQLLASGAADAAIVVRRVDGTAPDRRLEGHRDWVNTLAFTPDGLTLVSGSGSSEGRSADSRVLAWRLDGDTPPTVVGEHSDAVRAIAVGPDGALVASAASDKSVRLWSLSTGAMVAQMDGHTGRVFSVEFTPDGSRLVSAGRDRLVRIWDVASATEAMPALAGHELPVRAAAATGPTTVASAGRDGRLVFWDVSGTPTPRLVTVLDQPGRVTDVAVSPDGRTIATGARDGVVVLRDGDTGMPLGEPILASGAVDALAFATDGRRLYVAAMGGWLEAWDVKERRRTAGPVDAGPGAVLALAVSPDGLVASGGMSGVARLWRPGLEEDPRRLEGHTSWVTGLAFTAAEQLVSVGADGQAFAWDLTVDGVERRLLADDGGQFTSLAVSPKHGTVVLAGDIDGRIHLMDPTAESAKQQVVVAHQSDVTHLTVDMSGQQVISGDRSGSVALWSVEDGQLRAVGPGRSAGTSVTAGAFSAGARRLVTNGEAGILLWDNSIESWRNAACAIAGRGLTPQERRGYEPDLDGVRVCAAD